MAESLWELCAENVLNFCMPRFHFEGEKGEGAAFLRSVTAIVGVVPPPHASPPHPLGIIFSCAHSFDAHNASSNIDSLISKIF